ncbi:MAG: hypothetical protein PHQ04_10835 [Opitutaceae bacterium]|nr:hypothetical protein [Opitutaceae bacterium]
MKALDFTWIWPALRQLFTQQGFITVVCALLILSMTMRFHRFLRHIHPIVIPMTLLLVLLILVFHWTQTRTEPKIFSPAVEALARVLPAPTYQGEHVQQAAPAKPPPPKRR